MKQFTPFLVIGLLFASVLGQVPVVPTNPNREGEPRLPADSTPSAVHALATADLEAFLDGIVPQQLERENIAGATISVVKDGKLLFARGYGCIAASEARHPCARVPRPLRI